MDFVVFFLSLGPLQVHLSSMYDKKLRCEKKKKKKTYGKYGHSLD